MWRREQRLNAVSYTHLDVYKRQVLNRPSLYWAEGEEDICVWTSALKRSSPALNRAYSLCCYKPTLFYATTSFVEFVVSNFRTIDSIARRGCINRNNDPLLCAVNSYCLIVPYVGLAPHTCTKGSSTLYMPLYVHTELVFTIPVSDFSGRLALY